MRRKFYALIMIVLFIFTILNSTIVAEKDNNRISMIRDLFGDEEIFDINIFNNYTKDEDYLDLIVNDVFCDIEKFEDLDNSVIQNCIKNEDYSKLLEFMGNGSKLIKNAHVNASGMGTYIVKKIRYLKWGSPLPRLTRLGFFPPSLINQWLFYIKFNNISYMNNKVKKMVHSNATTLIEPENGDDPTIIRGNHTILALVWQIAPINKIIGLKKTLIRWYNWINEFKNESWTKIKPTFPWSLYKWRFKNFWNWLAPYPFLVIQELMYMISGWPFSVWTSFINQIWPSSIEGMATFVIYNDSLADS